MLYSSAVRRMLGCEAQSRGTARTPLRHGVFTYVPDFRHKSNLKHEQSGFESQSLPTKVMSPHTSLLPPEQ